MKGTPFLRLGSVREVGAFRDYLEQLQVKIPCDQELVGGPRSPLAQPIYLDGFKIHNRIAIHPMEGWDGTAEGRPTENTFRRWRRFGRSGAKLIWGGEAVAVRHEGRANPNQLLINPETSDDLARLREALVEEHQRTTGSREGLLVGLQLTHSGRYSRPNHQARPEPRILYHHPILDRRLELAPDYPLLTDGEIRSIIEAFHQAAILARKAGFDFVDIKHCHGYLGHEFLSAHTRQGDYGGSFENRTRFLREIVEGVRTRAPGLRLGVRLPYRWGFGVNARNPLEADLTETVRFLSLLRELNISLINLSAGSPYYNPHLQRPAYYPPSDGYQPPEDPLVEAARQMQVVHTLKEQFPALLFVGSAYSYFQDFLPHVAQAAVREGWVDCVGLGRMVLVYPEFLWDVLEGKQVDHRRVCRTFSDCTTAPRNGLPSGCYPLDGYYKHSPAATRLRALKAATRT
jgi:2,4-dienoyl-CoA reductase-like NADH-dependent reductase (Old Yellow Enzyme family)